MHQPSERLARKAACVGRAHVRCGARGDPDRAAPAQRRRAGRGRGSGCEHRQRSHAGQDGRPDSHEMTITGYRTLGGCYARPPPAAHLRRRMTKATQRRYAALDGLRGIAALVVFAIHVWIYQLPNTVELRRDSWEKIAAVRGAGGVRDVLRAVGLPAVPRVRASGAGPQRAGRRRQLSRAARGPHHARVLPRAGRDAASCSPRRATCRGAGWWTQGRFLSSSSSRRTTRPTRC